MNKDVWTQAEEEAERVRYERVRNMSLREKLEALERRGRLLGGMRDRVQARHKQAPATS